MIATALTVAIVVFGVGQLVLPPLVEHIVRGRLAQHGKVQSVEVSAFPAIELLFGDADSVTVKMASYNASESQVGTNLNQAAGVSNLKVTIGTVNSGLVKVNDVSLTKHGDQLMGSAQLTEADLRAAVLVLSSVSTVTSATGGVTVRGSAQIPLVGQVSADANVAARGGRVVLSGEGLIGSFVHLTVWSDPHVRVESISGATTDSGVRLMAVARLK
jgi:hypothetical protein